MSTVRDRRLTHVEKPKQSTLFQTNKVLCFLVLPDVMLAKESRSDAPRFTKHYRAAPGAARLLFASVEQAGGVAVTG